MMNLREIIKQIERETGFKGRALLKAVMDYLKKKAYLKEEELDAAREEAMERILGH
jgi:hypothetical protein